MLKKGSAFRPVVKIFRYKQLIQFLIIYGFLAWCDLSSAQVEPFRIRESRFFWLSPSPPIQTSTDRLRWCQLHWNRCLSGTNSSSDAKSMATTSSGFKLTYRATAQISPIDTRDLTLSNQSSSYRDGGLILFSQPYNQHRPGLIYSIAPLYVSFLLPLTINHYFILHLSS